MLLFVAVALARMVYARTTCYFIHGSGEDTPGPPTPSYDARHALQNNNVVIAQFIGRVN